MKIQIDLKSAALGLIAGAAAVFTLGDATSQSNENGRYEVVVSASPIDPEGGLGIIVDTRTGRTWGVNAKKSWHDDGVQFWNDKN